MNQVRIPITEVKAISKSASDSKTMEEKNRESAGQEFVRWLRPGGCALILIIMVLMLVTCFISGKNPSPDIRLPDLGILRRASR